VINLPELRTFYRRLSWEEADISSDNYAVFNTAGVLLSLFPVDELAKEAQIEISKSTDYFRAGVTLSINVDQREDVDLTIETIRNAGARILREPSDAFWGGRIAYFSDPENNLWEVAWNPTAVFDERGAMLSF
jgi:uncharacterized glyoxalase superfamily protein PhnB